MNARPLLTGLRMAVAVGLLAALVHFVPVENVLRTLASVSLPWLLPSAVIVFVWRLFAAERLAVFTQALGMHAGAMRLFGVSLVSSFFGAVTPGFALNGVVRWYLLSESGRFKTAALTALFGDRLFDLVMMMGLGLAGLASTGTPTPPWLRAASAVLFVVLLAGWLLALSRHAGKLLSMLASRLPARPAAVLTRLVTGLARYRELSVPLRLKVGALSLFANVTNALGMYCLFRALHLPLNLADAMWLRCAVFAVGVLPITILGIGAREAVLVTLLVPAGVAAPDAVAMGVILLARDLLAAAAGGVMLAFWREPLPQRLATREAAR